MEIDAGLLGEGKDDEARDRRCCEKNDDMGDTSRICTYAAQMRKERAGAFQWLLRRCFTYSHCPQAATLTVNDVQSRMGDQCKGFSLFYVNQF